MSYWGYVFEALNSEDRNAAERRMHRRRRVREREAEQARLAAVRAEEPVRLSPAADAVAKPARRSAAVVKQGV